MSGEDYYQLWKRYGRILRREPPVITGHPPMPRAERAAQFAPFAALTGFEDVIEEAGGQVKDEELERIEFVNPE